MHIHAGGHAGTVQLKPSCVIGRDVVVRADGKTSKAKVVRVDEMSSRGKPDGPEERQFGQSVKADRVKDMAPKMGSSFTALPSPVLSGEFRRFRRQHEIRMPTH